MRRNISAGFAIFGTLVLVATALMLVHPAAAAPQSSRWGADYFPNTVLTTHDGKTVRFYDDLIKGKIVVIDFIYTHCKDMCPLETARLAQVQKTLGDRVGRDIFFYSISIDPKVDTPEVLKSYAEQYHAGPGWLFLTGKKEDITILSKKLGLYTDPIDRDGHMPDLLIGNEATGQWIKNSALDNPKYLAIMIGDWLNSWKDHKVAKSYTEAPTIDISDRGRYLFASQCSACHSLGHGDLVGPDLRGVTKIRDREWLKHFIAAPDEMLASKDPIAAALLVKYKQVIMPNLRLPDSDVNDILEYLKTQATHGDGAATHEHTAAQAATLEGASRNP